MPKIIFDPNAASSDQSGIFGLPFTEKESALVLLPIPWEATTSYGGGTAKGPEAIAAASRQVDLYDLELGKAYEAGYFLLDEDKNIKTWNRSAMAKAKTVVANGGVGNDAKLKKDAAEVNAFSEKLNQSVYDSVRAQLKAGKKVGMIGGDHSTPFGGIKAILEKHPAMGILHVDAHCDLRKAFEGFEYSHASIMYNVLTKLPIQKLVQVGIRDFCEEEFDLIKKEKKRLTVFFDAHLQEEKFAGNTWKSLVKTIVQELPNEVYVSFDIDGLDPSLCPHTGTPVPGGLSFAEACYLIKAVVESGRTIVGFDLNEVSPGDSEWNGNVGARILYKLCGWTMKRK